jgi:hypothetical protein
MVFSAALVGALGGSLVLRLEAIVAFALGMAAGAAFACSRWPGLSAVDFVRSRRCELAVFRVPSPVPDLTLQPLHYEPLLVVTGPPGNGASDAGSALPISPTSRGSSRRRRWSPAVLPSRRSSGPACQARGSWCRAPRSTGATACWRALRSPGSDQKRATKAGRQEKPGCRSRHPGSRCRHSRSAGPRNLPAIPGLLA